MKQAGEKVPYGDRLCNLRICSWTLLQSYRHFSSLYLFLDALNTVFFFLLVERKSKFRVGSSVCTGTAGAVEVIWIFKQKLEIQHGHPLQPGATSQPPAPRKQVFSWDTPSRELLHCFLFCSKSRYEHLPITDSLYIKCGCISLVSPWWKNTWLIALGSTYPHARAMKSLFAPTQPVHVHWDVLGSAWGWRGSFVPTVHSHISLSDKNAERRLPSGRGQGGRHTLV